MERAARAFCGRLLCLTLVFITACAPDHVVEGVRGKVTGIKDGDTFEILIDNKPEIVRLAHIDCPERGQPYGTVAKKVASDLCFGKSVFVKEEGRRDRYGRMIGLVTLPNGRVVNKELVRVGVAWHFTRYSDDITYQKLERSARRARRGLWSDAQPVPPWEWRRR